MKKLTIITLALALALTLAACRRKENGNETTATKEPATETTQETTMLPDIDPTLETNIPDPEVDTSMPDMTDMMDGAENETNNDQNKK